MGQYGLPWPLFLSLKRDNKIVTVSCEPCGPLSATFLSTRFVLATAIRPQSHYPDFYVLF